MKIRFDALTPAIQMQGQDEQDAELLKQALVEAEKYLLGFKWCLAIRERYFGLGVGGVVSVFLFLIDLKADADDWLWVIVGDLPSAYLVTDDAPDPLSALRTYCDLMEEWANAVKTGKGIEKVFPVSAFLNTENAAHLESRINFLRQEIIPAFNLTEKRMSFRPSHPYKI